MVPPADVTLMVEVSEYVVNAKAKTFELRVLFCASACSKGVDWDDESASHPNPNNPEL